MSCQKRSRRGAGTSIRVALGAAAFAGLLVAAAATAYAGSACVSSSCAPPPLTDTGRADIASTYGSGSFGRWGSIAFGLPVYRYTVDEPRDPNARQLELDGATGAQHQVGNDHIKGMAFNDGYTQFWSEDRLLAVGQPLPTRQPALRRRLRLLRHLHVGRHDEYQHPVPRPSARMRTSSASSVSATTTRAACARNAGHSEDVYAPFGNDPVLLHDVTITNDRTRHAALRGLSTGTSTRTTRLDAATRRGSRGRRGRRQADARGRAATA